MLKITTIPNLEKSVQVRLEGKLLEPWLGELDAECDRVAARGQEIGFDLSAVDFVDQAAAQWLRERLRNGARITACSGFVAELLHLEKRK